MRDLGISDLVEITGLSNRYWQRLAESGLDPAKWFVRVSGKRRVKDAIKRARKTALAPP